MKAEIKEPAEETPARPIKELAEGSRPRTETEKTEGGKRKNGDCPTSHAYRCASKVILYLEVIIFLPTNECSHLALYYSD